MKKILFIIIAFLPTFISTPLRKMMGAKIGKRSKIKYGSLIFVKHIHIDDDVTIGPFNVIIAESLKIGKNTNVRALTFMRSSVIEMGQNVVIQLFVFIQGNNNPSSIFKIGDFSAIYNFTYIEPSNMIEIGKRVGIGGYSLLFTHSNWSDFIDGAPITKGSIVIEDDVWIPWNVFIGPGSYIEQKSIIGANSLVTSRIPAGSYASGTPAKVVHEGIYLRISKKRKIKNAQYIIDTFFKTYQDLLDNIRIQINSVENLEKGDIYVIIEEQIEDIILQDLLEKGVHILNHPSRIFTFTKYKYSSLT